MTLQANSYTISDKLILENPTFISLETTSCESLLCTHTDTFCTTISRQSLENSSLRTFHHEGTWCWSTREPTRVIGVPLTHARAHHTVALHDHTSHGVCHVLVNAYFRIRRRNTDVTTGRRTTLFCACAMPVTSAVTSATMITTILWTNTRFVCASCIL